MFPYFIDTFYLIALANRKDNWHQRVVVFSKLLEGCPLYTVDEVLIEFLNYTCARGAQSRQRATSIVKDLLQNPQVTVFVSSRNSFLKALCFYESRLDKGYSLTDCVSMLTMRREQLTKILSGDHHFKQEGFSPMFTE